jgi:pimeloyl-ACP methyl ester carboxylesterase
VRRAKLYDETKAKPNEQISYEQDKGINFSDIPNIDNLKDRRKSVIEEANRRDEIDKQYLNQREISVNIPGYGEQKARIIDIRPVGEEVDDKPPILLIPGISNDLECVSNLATEIAYQGRRVIAVGYPESFMGKTTPEFADAVEKDEGFGPHAEFYKAIVDKYSGENGLEIWGYSTGAPIASTILEQKAFQDKITDAVLLCPAGAVDQSVNDMKLGAIQELKYLKDSGFNAGVDFHSLVIGGRKEQMKEDKILHDKIFNSLFEKICQAHTEWEKARVREGGKITVLNGEQDRITKSFLVKQGVWKTNPQINSEVIKDGYHSTPLMKPQEVVAQIFRAQRGL